MAGTMRSLLQTYSVFDFLDANSELEWSTPLEENAARVRARMHNPAVAVPPGARGRRLSEAHGRRLAEEKGANVMSVADRAVATERAEYMVELWKLPIVPLKNHIEKVQWWGPDGLLRRTSKVKSIDELVSPYSHDATLMDYKVELEEGFIRHRHLMGSASLLGDGRRFSVFPIV